MGEDSDAAGEGGGGHEVANEDVLLVDEGRVEELGKGLDVEDGHHVRVRPKEEGEGRGDVGAVDGALVEFDAFSEEGVGALEPEVVQAVFEGAEDGETIAAWDGSERKLAMHVGGGRRGGAYVVGGGGHVFVQLGFGWLDCSLLTGRLCCNTNRCYVMV